YDFGGPTRGVGARMTWKGDASTIGSGSQEIVESRPYEQVKSSLVFGSHGVVTAQFTLTPEGSRTRITWGMDTDLGMNPVSRYFGLMLEKMVGPDYEKGLWGLKRLAESLPKADFSDLKVEEIQVSPLTVAYIPASCGTDEREIARTIGASYAKVGKFIASHKLKQAAAPITINNKWGDSGYEFDAAIPLDRAPEGAVPPDSPVQVKQTYSGKALKVVHKGSHRNMDTTHEKLMAYAAAYGYEPAASPWDEYVSDPGHTPEPELLTNIVLPVK
ncbi:MAG: GyrI-like domain-containing protein, partial [Acidobacteria bacterium]|nr:GyrI-like domain-containing protein [Acidobacteriota bacterium]